EDRGSASGHGDAELMAARDCSGGAREAGVDVNAVRRIHAAARLGDGGAREGERARPRQPRGLPASPPPRSGSRRVPPDPQARPSAFLYVARSHAVAIIAAMPNALTRTLALSLSETSTRKKCPAKAKNTPRQKISSECWPHSTSGRSSCDFSGGQSRGTKRTVNTASARKCANRSGSRLTLSIGYMKSASHRGT